MRLTISVAGDRSLCQAAAKCVRKDGHDGEHWPTGESPGFGPADPSSSEPVEGIGSNGKEL